MRESSHQTIIKTVVYDAFWGAWRKSSSRSEWKALCLQGFRTLFITFPPNWKKPYKTLVKWRKLQNTLVKWRKPCKSLVQWRESLWNHTEMKENLTIKSGNLTITQLRSLRVIIFHAPVGGQWVDLKIVDKSISERNWAGQPGSYRLGSFAAGGGGMLRTTV